MLRLEVEVAQLGTFRYCPGRSQLQLLYQDLQGRWNTAREYILEPAFSDGDIIKVEQLEDDGVVMVQTNATIMYQFQLSPDGENYVFKQHEQHQKIKDFSLYAGDIFFLESDRPEIFSLPDPEKAPVVNERALWVTVHMGVVYYGTRTGTYAAQVFSSNSKQIGGVTEFDFTLVYNFMVLQNRVIDIATNKTILTFEQEAIWAPHDQIFVDGEFIHLGGLLIQPLHIFTAFGLTYTAAALLMAVAFTK